MKIALVLIMGALHDGHLALILEDRKSKDPEVEYNLTLLTWSDSLEESEDENNEDNF